MACCIACVLPSLPLTTYYLLRTSISSMSSTSDGRNLATASSALTLSSVFCLVGGSNAARSGPRREESERRPKQPQLCSRAWEEGTSNRV